jgi:hypothetical protein
MKDDDSYNNNDDDEYMYENALVARTGVESRCVVTYLSNSA